MNVKKFFEELEFDLPTALIAALVELLDSMPAASLTPANVSGIQNEQGVYQLFLDGELVYIGKTDGDAGLQSRLKRHAKKIQGRVGLDSSRVTFKAVRIYVFTAMDLEELLIDHYKLTSLNSWNHSGFGANDPGRERDTTTLKSHHFDKRYPIRLDLPVTVGEPGERLSAHEFLNRLRSSVPYLVRAAKAGVGKKPHADLDGIFLAAPPVPLSVEQALKLVGNALGSTWQITVLPGYVIVYKESRSYQEGRVL